MSCILSNLNWKIMALQDFRKGIPTFEIKLPIKCNMLKQAIQILGYK
jgi:hypothetical protein